MALQFSKLWSHRLRRAPANVLGGGRGYSLILPIRVCAAQRRRDFGTPDLKRGVHIRDVF